MSKIEKSTAALEKKDAHITEAQENLKKKQEQLQKEGDGKQKTKERYDDKTKPGKLFSQIKNEDSLDDKTRQLMMELGMTDDSIVPDGKKSPRLAKRISQQHPKIKKVLSFEMEPNQSNNFISQISQQRHFNDGQTALNAYLVKHFEEMQARILSLE